MKFSVEKVTSVKKRENKKLRDIMIEKENLHIEDLISYDEFLRLYSIYGKSFTKEDFATIFLDIKRTDLEHFEEGGNRKILKKEEIDDIEIALMKLHIIKFLNLKKGEEKTYNKIEEIYKSVSSKLNIISFSEKVLDILRVDLAKIKFDRTKKREILNNTDDEYFSEKDEVELEKYIKDTVSAKKNANSNLRDTIAMDMNLHIEEKITRDKFLELYEIYGEDEFTQFDFAKEILGMTESKARKLIGDKIADAKIWEDEVLDLDYLLKIREETIFDENLHIRDEISYKEFKEIYKKHSRILSESDFATEILDMSKRGFRDFRDPQRKNRKCQILSDIQIPKEFYPDAKKQIQEKENVYFGKSISYVEFQELYKKYGFVTNEMEFAEEVLEISKKGFPEFKDGTIKTKRIFLKSKKLSQGEDTIEYTPKQIEKLREIVIKENKLHIEDSITGEEFVNIYNKYGSGMSQKSFANKILDISEERMKDIVNDYEKRKGKSSIEDDEVKTGILRNEKVSDKEIDRIRKKVFETSGHYKGELIDYREFKRLHDMYGEKISERQFSEDILFIAGHMKNNVDSENGKRAIYSRFEFSDADIVNLKARVIKENLLYFEQRITPGFFEKLYKDSSTIMSRPQFAQDILEISKDDYGHMFYRDSIKTCKILSISGSMENKREFLKRRENEIFAMLIQGLSIEEIYNKMNKIYDYNDIEQLKIQYEFKIEGIKEMIQNGLDYCEVEKKLNISHNTLLLVIKKLCEEDKEYKSELELQKQKVMDEKAELVQWASNFKNFEALERRCIKIIDEMIDTKKCRANIISYINLCQEKYNEDLSKIPAKTLNTLHNALEFIDYDTVDLKKCTFFTKACIANMQYERANRFITFSMQNELITVSDKKKLHQLRKSISIAKRKSREISTREVSKKERVIA